MNTTFKKALSVMLCVIIAMSCLSVGGYAVSQEDWASYWDSYSSTGYAAYASPGKDETQRGISWYSPAGDYAASVKLSLSTDMKDSQTFSSGKNILKTPEGDRANKIIVSGLEKGKTYYYTCSVGENEFTCVQSFTTSAGSDFSAFYTTDIHISDDNLEATTCNLNSALKSAFAVNSGISLFLSAGDQATSALRSEYTGFVSSPFMQRLTVAPSIGNHDRKAVNYKYFKNVPNENKCYFTSSYIGSDYYFTKGDVLFLMLDTNNVSAADHRNFIRSAVRANPDCKWRVAVFHHDLYGGRIEKREQENELLRLILTPIIDEFKIDLALMGHSHFYTISNVIYNDETVLPTKDLDEVVDPKGTIYMVSGSINSARVPDTEPPLGKSIGKSYLTSEKIYNILDFSEDSVTIKSYTVESGEFESFKITKTSPSGGLPGARTAFHDPCIRFISIIAAFFNNFGQTFKYFEAYLKDIFNK